MQTLETLNIDLPTDVAETLRQAVRVGDFATENDAVQDAIRHWAHERSAPVVNSVDELRALWFEAVADDSDGEDAEPILEALERKYRALAEGTSR